MVKVVYLVGFLVLPAIAFAQLATLKAIKDLGNTVVRTGLSKILRFNETQIDRVMASENSALPPHEFAVDLTDDNWEAILRTGTANPLASPLPDDTVWVITVYGPDQFSHMLSKATDEVATYNSSAAGGTLPSEMRFARINYNTETVLPTRFWLWKVPVVVIATDNMKTLRFIKLGTIRPFVEPISRFLAKRDWWESVPIWKGTLAPGGAGENYLVHVARAWAAYHYYLSQIPMFVILMFSGMLANFVLSFFHSTPELARAPMATDSQNDKGSGATSSLLASRAPELESDSAQTFSTASTSANDSVKKRVTRPKK